MRILLIDDDPEVRFLAGFVLEQAGHVVTSAESGAAGRSRAENDAFDLILLDYRLGDATGDELLPALLALRNAPPVVFLTGRDDAATARRLRNLGAADVIPKPFDPERLADRVAEAVRRDPDATGPN